MLSTTIKDLDVLQFETLQVAACLHFSTTRLGGVSEGNYESLNLGNFSDDSKEHIMKNRLRLAQALGISSDNFFVPHQTHGSESLVIDQFFLSQSKSQQEKYLEGIDALIIQEKNICIGVTTADCVPILIFDPKKKVLAAIHAGWKGIVAQIAPKVVVRMTTQFGCNPRDMIAGIAPCISQEIFEVGDDVEKHFQQSEFDLSLISSRNPNTEKAHIDLRKANKLALIKVGIPHQSIEIADICTYSNPELFFSARRQTIHSGRMLTGGLLL